jgi:Protein of unknown function (DUF1552)
MNNLRKKWLISRRHFIQGFGVSLSLPLLDCMFVNDALAQNTQRKRFFWIYIPNGAGHRSTVDSGFYSAPNYLKDLVAPLAGDISILQNTALFGKNGQMMYNPKPPTTGNAHPNAFVGYVSGGMSPLKLGDCVKSFDQYIADVNQGSKTRTLGLVANFDSDVYQFNNLQAHTMSFSAPGQPVPYEINPKVAFDALFGSALPVQNDTRLQDQITRKRSILHYVNQELKRFNLGLGREDKARMDQYATSLNEFDKKLVSQQSSGGSSISCQAPAGIVTTTRYAEAVTHMYELAYFANLCDLTRVTTLMHAMEGTSLEHKSFVTGLTSGAGPWHGLSHLTPNYQGSNPTEDLNYADLMKISVWHYSKVTNFIKRLKDTALPNGQGNLLDESAVLAGSSIANGLSHDTRGLTHLLAGTAGGTLKKGLNLDLGNALFADLNITLMQAFGVNINSYGLGSAPIAQLKS